VAHEDRRTANITLGPENLRSLNRITRFDPRRTPAATPAASSSTAATGGTPSQGEAPPAPAAGAGEQGTSE
jgi:hypothetical protein